MFELDDAYLTIALNTATRKAVEAGRLDINASMALNSYLIDNQIMLFVRNRLNGIHCFKGFHLIHPDTPQPVSLTSEEWGTIVCAGTPIRIDYCTAYELLQPQDTDLTDVGWFTLRI